jgi:hypothetical protein
VEIIIKDVVKPRLTITDNRVTLKYNNKTSPFIKNIIETSIVQIEKFTTKLNIPVVLRGNFVNYTHKNTGKEMYKFNVCTKDKKYRMVFWLSPEGNIIHASYKKEDKTDIFYL